MDFPWFDPHHPMFRCHNNILCQKDIEMRKLNHRLQYIVAIKRISQIMWLACAVEDDVRVQKLNEGYSSILRYNNNGVRHA